MTQELESGVRAQALSDTNDDESPSFAPNGRLLVYATPHAGQ
jgi:TolB protein